MIVNDKIYFAHPVSDYGTEREKVCLKLIRGKFTLSPGELVNPNSKFHQKAYKLIGMEYFTSLAKTCMTVIAVPFKNGKYGMGVYKEMESVGSNGGVVYSLIPETGEIKEVDFRDIRPLSINQTRLRIRRCKNEV